MHEMSKPIFWQNKINISKCCLMKFLPSMLCIKSTKLCNQFKVIDKLFCFNLKVFYIEIFLIFPQNNNNKYKF